MKEKYGTLDTWKFLLKEGWSYSHKMTIRITVEAIINAFSGYATVLLPSLIVGDLERGTDLTILICKVLFYFSIIALLAILSEAASNQNMIDLIRFRIHYLPAVIEDCMNSDYETYVKEETQDMLEKGFLATSTNGRGIEGFYHHFTVILTCVVELVIYSGLIGKLSLWMILTVIGLSVFSYFLKDRFNRKYDAAREKDAENEVHIRYFSNLPYDIATGKDIRLYQMQNMLKEKFEKYNRKKINNADQTEKYMCESNVVTSVITFIKDVLCYGFLIHAMIQENMDVAQFVLYIGSFSAFSREFGKLSDYLSMTSVDISMTRDFRKLKEVLKPVNGAEVTESDDLDIQFEHVYFRYNEKERWILEDFSLHIHPHEKLALVGINGAGKTTIVKLLCRLLHPVKGRILINGTDLEDIDFDDYRKKIGCVFQNTEPFEFSVGTNISGSDRKVLDHVSLKFNVGEKLAVVGKNGAGKTTMIKLLCRLYEPTEGEILLNGINIWKYSYQEYTEIFAPVFQDYSLFSLSLEDNIAFDKDEDETRVTESLSKVGLKERVEKLPEGIHTQLNHDNGEGVDLSGGEGQRVAIARALYKDAPFIILDEPAASLDPIAEAEIYEKFDELVHGKTSIYISHRMSSCQFCDRIIVFKEGKIIETGTHDSLIKQNGEYAELFNTQAEYYQ